MWNLIFASIGLIERFNKAHYFSLNTRVIFALKNKEVDAFIRL
jgi:hypothetical protein